LKQRLQKKVRATKSAKVGLSVRFWGVRGSIPAPGPRTARYGGNTSCIEVRCGDELLIFDLGTGVRALGDQLRRPVTGHVFVSHYHYDHLQGLPFFTPIFDPSSRFVFHGPTREGRAISHIISGQMQRPYFPVTTEMVFKAAISYEPIAEGDRVVIGEGTVTALELHHPGMSLAYRVDYRGRSVVYATDTEHGPEADNRLIDFAADSDLLVYDAMYTDAEYHGKTGASKVGWGHSTWQHGVRIADAAQVKMLALFHHEPGRDDASMDKVVNLVRKHRKATFAAKELQRVEL
jgi:phosphoribosyl 1,2-cyclic phosphodiesterase